jgi:peptidoglycan/xylan/chitin deacetylase (PgdA/CDA1 family)
MKSAPLLLASLFLLAVSACSRTDGPAWAVEVGDVLRSAARLVHQPDPSPPIMPDPSGGPEAAEPTPLAPGGHVVEPGDTIHAIAARYGTTAAALVFVNGLRGSRLAPGRTLQVPDGDPRPPAPALERYAGATVIDRGVATRRSVALTFDAGADRGYAELILDVLRDHGVRASFGMTGVWARQNPDLVWRMAAEGHRFINHTWDHGSFTGLSTRTRALTTAERWAQLDRTDTLLVELTGQSSRPFFRSPYGDLDAGVQRDIAARGYAYNVLWTVDSGGWRGIPARSIIDICLRNARPGAIYVMHVGAAAQDGPALPAIIAGLVAAGYDFETIEEILGE